MKIEPPAQNPIQTHPLIVAGFASDIALCSSHTFNLPPADLWNRNISSMNSPTMTSKGDNVAAIGCEEAEWNLRIVLCSMDAGKSRPLWGHQDSETDSCADAEEKDH